MNVETRVNVGGGLRRQNTVSVVSCIYQIRRRDTPEVYLLRIRCIEIG